MSENREKSPRRKDRPSFLWPIVLIFVGGIFLLSNLGLVDENNWDNIWQLWPLILIVIGLDSLFRRNEIAGPVFMIGLGAAFLLSSAGWLNWMDWDVLWRLWPILLISVGLEIMIGRRSLWLSLLTVVVIVGILGGVLWMMGLSPASGNRLADEVINQTLEDISQAKIAISPAVGELLVDGLVDSNALIAGEVSTGTTRQIFTDYSVSGSTGYYSIDSRSVTRFSNNSAWDWDLGLTTRIPLDLDLALGAGAMEIDLSRLTLTDLDVSQGVGDMVLVLPPEEEYRADISQGIGSIVIEVSKDAGIRLEVSRAISDLSLPSDFEKNDDYYYSPNYDDVDEQINVEISQAIGSIVVRYGE
jgi:hypothetical protein